MRISSLYKFYQSYFKVPAKEITKQTKYYAWCIGDAKRVLESAYRLKSRNPIDEYKEEKYSRELSRTFIENFEYLAHEVCDDPFKNIIYNKAKINISKEELGYGNKNIVIPCPYIINKKSKEIIILNFGPSDNIKNEIPVLKGLASYFKLDIPIPDYVEEILYWDLRNGIQTRENYRHALKVSKKSLLEVLKQFVN